MTAVQATLVPPVLHQIWLGTLQIPAWVEHGWALWDEALPSGWTTRRHTELTIKDTVLEPALTLGQRYDLHPRGQADLVRLLALTHEGGVYVDSDTVPLRSPAALAHRPAWIGRPPTERSPLVLTNGCAGFPPGHPFPAAVWERAQQQLQRGVRNDHFVAGPRAWAEVYRTQHRGLATGSDRLPIEPAFAMTWSTRLRRLLWGDLDGLRSALPELARQYPAQHVLHISYGALQP